MSGRPGAAYACGDDVPQAPRAGPQAALHPGAVASMSATRR
ncbi:hypothetical protein [Streptomyces olivaceus]|nr:hypothetical protein [Streptomyces olivaceus]